MVSVEPCITDAKVPIKLSGPYLLRISPSNTKELEPDIGLSKARDNTSLGKCIIDKIVERKELKHTLYKLIQFHK